MAPQYYFVSDLHMGGDGQLQHCDYAAEFIAFLKGLEQQGPDTELLIVGDTFGFWELTLVRGLEKLDHIIAAHRAFRPTPSHARAAVCDYRRRRVSWSSWLGVLLSPKYTN